MIISHPILNRFSPAIREAQPQIGDDVVHIANKFHLTGMPPEPLFRAGPLFGKVYESSFAIQFNSQVANGAQATAQIGTLGPGWWRLKLTGCYRSNYVEAAVNPGDYRFLMADLVSNWQAISIWAQLSGTQNIDFELELFLSQTLVMTSILDANGVGQAHAITLAVVGNKYL